MNDVPKLEIRKIRDDLKGMVDKHKMGQTLWYCVECMSMCKKHGEYGDNIIARADGYACGSIGDVIKTLNHLLKYCKYCVMEEKYRKRDKVTVKWIHAIIKRYPDTDPSDMHEKCLECKETICGKDGYGSIMGRHMSHIKDGKVE